VKRGKEGKICGADDGDNNDGDDNNGENDPKNQFQIYFLPIPKQKRHQNLFHMGHGNKAALLVPWCAHCKRVEMGIDYLV
jgi:hypothetical protein